MLSLASSVVFLASVAFLILSPIREWGTPPVVVFLAIFVPVVLPVASLVILARRRFLQKENIPFFDGWFIHLVILVPYVWAAVGRSLS